MTEDKVKNLWGEEFRIVAEGLAETDVVIFVEKMMRRHRESLEQLDHIAALHELATKTVQDAEGLASDIKENAQAEAQAEARRLIEDAEAKAAEVLDGAEEAAIERVKTQGERLATVGEEYRRKARERLAGIDSALKGLEEAATRELSTRMPSHYIGKHLYQSVHFLPAFRELMREIKSGLARDERESSEAMEAESPPKSSDPVEPHTCRRR